MIRRTTNRWAAAVALGVGLASIVTGCDQVLPSYVTAWKLRSTAMQNLAVGHETEVRPPPFGSMLRGDDHVALAAL